MVSNPKKILTVFGTRPEVIKLSPLIHELEANKYLSPIVCNTGQHEEMTNSAMDVFDIKADINLKVMRHGQTLSQLSTQLLEKLSNTFIENEPDLVLVHGDTTSALMAAWAAFLEGIPIGHVEAGLRTYDLNSPFPEEANRQLITRLSTLHFCPTKDDEKRIKLESPFNKSQCIVTGNTVVDALLQTSSRLDNGDLKVDRKMFSDSWSAIHDHSSKLKIIITGHRRENIGEGIENLCSAIYHIATKYDDVLFVFPVHLNPKVKEPVHKHLAGLKNVKLIDPLPYGEFIYLMKNSDLVITDSGGIQEEAPSLGLKVLVTRKETERELAVRSGVADLIGQDAEALINAVEKFIYERKLHSSRKNFYNPYGDGKASQKIVRAIQNYFNF